MASYDGDMTIEQVPIADRTDTEYTVYVNKVPVELNEDAIRDIFGQYGKITGMFHPRNAKWAYITYGSYREAELAIRELNEKKPLHLKVVLAKERSFVREEQKQPIAVGDFEKPNVMDTADSPPVHYERKCLSMGRGQSIKVVRKQVMPQQMAVPYKYGDYRSSPFSQAHDVYEIEDPYVKTDNLWTRGMITITPDGKRHVSLGRGYTLYEYPEPYPKVEECISKVYEQRNNGLYEYSEDKLGIQNCSVCSTKTTKHCEKCHTYYCSKTCQLGDWPRHQAECERIPALVEETIDGMSSLKIDQDVNQIRKTSTVPQTTSKIANSDDIKLRRPNSSSTNANVKDNTDVACNSMHNGTKDRKGRYSFDQHDNDVNTSQTKLTDQPINTTKTKEFSQQHRLRKYDGNESGNQSRKNNEFSSTSNSPDQGRHNRNYQSDSDRSSLKEKRNNSDVRDRTNNNDRNQKDRFQNAKSSARFNGREHTGNREHRQTSYNTSASNDLAFYKDTHLSKTKFITVQIIISLDNSEYWISKVEDAEACTDLMVKLQDVAKNAHNVQPMVGEIYGVLYEDIWHRGMITSLNPLMVHFIDFGNDEVLNKDDAIKDIGELVKAPKFARKIRLTQGTSEKYRNLQPNDNISVRMLSVDSDKTIMVEVQEQSNSSSSHTTQNASNNTVEQLESKEDSKMSPNKDTAQISSVLGVLTNLLTQKAVSKLRIAGFIRLSESTQNDTYSAVLTPDVYKIETDMVLKDLQIACSQIHGVTDYKPKAEELVCGKCADGWYRGYVSMSDASANWSIFKIDEARSQSADKIVPCPKKYLNICALGVICEIMNYPTNIELQVGNRYEFTALLNENNREQENLKIEIIVNSEVIEAVVRPGRRSSGNSIPVLSELKNGSKICLTSYRNHYYMFARSLDDDQVEYYNNVMQTVARYAQTAPHLTEPPVNQQVVIAPFEDGNSYRAMILKTENDKARIVYIDFGNIDDVNIKDLKAIPQSHTLQQSCAAKVILKDVPRDKPSNQEVDLYIRDLLGKEMPLICTYEGTSPKDGVCLTTLTGECVNDKINELLIPGWKRGNDDNTKCYMLKDIKVASLGRVGDTVDALVLFKLEDCETVCVMGPFDMELMTYIFDVMPALLTEYCEKTEYYIPRVHELCLALYEGAWYRAVCLNPKESHTTSQIFFIDYGNIESVEHKNIRLMPKDFITPEALANTCKIVNLAPVDDNENYSEAVQKKLKELVVPMNSRVKVKIVECLDNGEYNIELPEVRDALIKHNLI